jgi:tRNA A37 threonylcarbamoyladenosine dehydratase
MSSRTDRGTVGSDRFARQQFLGPRSDALLQVLRVGIVGLGGGGSHIAQQLAHVGVGELRLFDSQRIELSNLNRLVGATVRDVARSGWKTAIARRLVRGVSPTTRVLEFRTQWQESATWLRDCDVIVGCVDTYAERDQLELHSRRYLIPYVDVGMDVTRLSADRFAVSGQVILSVAGGPCMRCLGFLRDELLAQEAAGYGAAGSRPQVVWSNGVLASTAVGLVVQLVLPWSGTASPVYLEYDGNRGTIVPSPRLQYAPAQCTHFDGLEHLGDPWFSLAKR